MSANSEVLAKAKISAVAVYLQTYAFQLMPGICESLERLNAAGLRKGMVTGARIFTIAAILRPYTMAPEFEVVVSADEVIYNKPVPDC